MTNQKHIINLLCDGCGGEIFYIDTLWEELNSSSNCIQAVCCEVCEKIIPVDDWVNELELDFQNDLIVWGKKSVPDFNEEYKPKYYVNGAGGSEAGTLYNIFQKRTTRAESLDYSEENLRYYIENRTASKILVVRNLVAQPLGFTLVHSLGLWGFIDVFVIDPDHESLGAGTTLMRGIFAQAKIQSWKVLECFQESSNKRVDGFLGKFKFNYLDMPLQLRYKFVCPSGTL